MYNQGGKPEQMAKSEVLVHTAGQWDGERGQSLKDWLRWDRSEQGGLLQIRLGSLGCIKMHSCGMDITCIETYIGESNIW